MTLDPEILERILLDRSLGEMAPDTEALLQAYLAHHPQAARMVERTDHTVGMARAALRIDQPTDIGDLPPPSFLSENSTARQVGRRSWTWRRTIAAAAMIVMAFWLGRQTPPQQPFHEPALVQSQVGSQRQTPPDSKGGFWSVARLRRAFSARSTSSYRMIQWSFPLRRPHFGGQS